MTDYAHHAPELRDLVQALGPLIAHVQLLTTTPTGFMVRMAKDTPRPALEAAYVAFDRHADHLRTQAAAKVDALASGGMDDFEIPAFLRKQAD
jgi:cell division protein FtsZ